MKQRNLDAKALLLLAQDSPPGYQLLLEYLREMRCGKIPKTVVTRQLSKAFDEILFKSVEPLTALKLRRIGAPTKTIPRLLAEYAGNQPKGKIVAFIEHQLEKDSHITHAYELAAERFGKSRRQIERIWKDYAPLFSRHGKAARLGNALIEALNVSLRHPSLPDVDAITKPRTQRTSATSRKQRSKRARASVKRSARHDT